ncbi:transcriptional regulator [Vibrio sp. 99-70-13A1]|uniref:winged helix-turn-helix domain-containing protein n=1 Tax=Vibrio sp. 99-70-13A1 TaxID=2607601 RepID=UPI0014934458|nr:transcriptional regulator [Vibrio sp. 99-70-13A1]NOH99251.1 transcriptional regulator [Vibrio sp. 99-70-13A1]
MSNIGTKFILAQRFVFDPNSNSLVDQMNDSDVVRLGSNESRILLMLSERPNEVITRNELHEYVWRDQGFEVDDSSLTQAVSTLRKMLKDSTKSPEFVKTVPKRGYQFIASVERSAPLSSSDTPINIDTSILGKSLDQEIEFSEVETQETERTATQHESVDVVESAQEIPKIETPTKVKAQENPWLSRGIILLALLLPILVLTFTTPAESEFRTLSTVDSVDILYPMNQPNLDSWLPAIEKCVAHYTAEHQGDLKPSKVIATGGQGNQLVLNYVHSQEYSSENITLRIFANQTDLSSICKGNH